MKPIERVIRQSGYFLRRRDLLALGYSDKRIKRALASHTIFRVWQGWYSIPDAPAPAIAAVRVGGALTGIAALESYGIPVPRRKRVNLLVPHNACRLRNPRVRFSRLEKDHRVDVHWSDEPRGDRRLWRVSIAEALLHVLATEPKHIAVACASAIMHLRRLDRRQLSEIFACAPLWTRSWEALVSALDESHGETFTRLLLIDAGIPFAQQHRIAGVGRLDFKVAAGVYLEVDGAQHDPGWTGEGESSYIPDNFRDLHMRNRDSIVIRIIYPVLYGAWEECLTGIKLAIARDLELRARRERHPTPRNRSE